MLLTPPDVTIAIPMVHTILYYGTADNSWNDPPFVLVVVAIVVMAAVSGPAVAPITVAVAIIMHVIAIVHVVAVVIAARGDVLQ